MWSLALRPASYQIKNLSIHQHSSVVPFRHGSAIGRNLNTKIAFKIRLELAPVVYFLIGTLCNAKLFLATMVGQQFAPDSYRRYTYRQTFRPKAVLSVCRHSSIGFTSNHRTFVSLTEEFLQRPFARRQMVTPGDVGRLYSVESILPCLFPGFRK